MVNVFELEAIWAKELEIKFECEEVYDGHD
jgi:hypothetical protein